ncbi:MAG: hypothetical protein KatS3mg031_0066 [Chitinophagales bacterium]|nr:MAG: hypothetical protein KatS3mg031_0066 [Chitinophagales bacterium]
MITFPLIILAFLSAVGGFLGLPAILHAPHLLSEFLHPIYEGSEKIHAALGIEHGHLSHTTEWILIGVTVAAVLITIFVASRIYSSYEKEEEPTSFIKKLVYNKYYVDELYDLIIVKPVMRISDFFYSVFESVFIDGLSVALGKGALGAARLLRLLQTGSVGAYLFIMVIGILAMILTTYFIS